MLAAQILALITFIVMIVFMAIDKIEKWIVALSCGVFTIAFVLGACLQDSQAILDVLSVHEIIEKGFWYGDIEFTSGINWASIIFLFGMLFMVENMNRVGFFRWMCLGIAKLVKYNVFAIFISFMVLSFVISMFIDSITVVVFMVVITIEFSRFLKFDPIPMVLSIIFCANIGGAATFSGDPPNIILGVGYHLDFVQFISNTGWVCAIILVVAILYFSLIFGKKYINLPKISEADLPEIKYAIIDKTGFIGYGMIFLLIAALIVSHAYIRLSIASIGIIAIGLSLLSAPRHIGEMIKSMDYKTILYLIGLFIVVGGLEETGVLEIVASWIAGEANGNLLHLLGLLILASALFSAFVDNIPFAAGMIPIIRTLALSQGVPFETLVWSVSLGTNIGGCATPIGACANDIALANAKEYGIGIKNTHYAKYMVPLTMISFVVAFGCVMIVNSKI